MPAKLDVKASCLPPTYVAPKLLALELNRRGGFPAGLLCGGERLPHGGDAEDPTSGITVPCAGR